MRKSFLVAAIFIYFLLFCGTWFAFDKTLKYLPPKDVIFAEKTPYEKHISVKEFLQSAKSYVRTINFSVTDLNNNEKKYPSDPFKSQIFTSDIDLFWQAFDRLTIDEKKNPFQEFYIDRGSAGLKAFIPERIVSADELYKLVVTEKSYYRQIKPSTLNVRQYEKQIRASYYALKYWYPKAVFPPVYFVIGRTTSGGTASEAGMIIGSEVFAENAYKTAYGRPTLKSDYIPFIVAHEIIHFLQKNYTGRSTLLKECIREGSADFIAELTAGETVKRLNGDDVYEYGDKHEKTLLREFIKQKDSEDLSPWLYAQTKDGRPQNLGYWAGYKIVESYFRRQKDKKRAIGDILNIRDYETFFKASGIN